ncbi:hypothetical protein R1flu_012821 [Riccia fluitans]|uniref:Negatively light-regulated protein n=1 Tax=Riccia fluitans TaxID=41844 RepID=A0ABD1ZCV9_9MARC
MAGAGASNLVADRPAEEEGMPTPEQQEALLKKKYGGLIPKKPSLISKDHERAFFDSADWALGKQGAGGATGAKPQREGLRPKLQPSSRHQQLPARRASLHHRDGEDGDGNGEAEKEVGAGSVAAAK